MKINFENMDWNFRIIIACSSNFSDYPLLCRTLDDYISRFVPAFQVSVTILVAAQEGATLMGERYAKERGYALMRFPLEEKKHHDLAELYRNVAMVRAALTPDFYGVLFTFLDGQECETENILLAAQIYQLDIHTLQIG